MRNKTIGIYGIKNIKSNKFYIGMSTNIENRKRDHFYHLKSNNHHSPKLQNSYNKYGKNYFIFGIIESCSIELLYEKERYWIDFYNSVNTGYNCIVPNGINQGHLWKEKDKEKLSISMKKYHSTVPKYKQKTHMDRIRALRTNFTGSGFKKVYLYDPTTLELKHTLPSIVECANFLNTTNKHLNKMLARLWKERGQTYKGFYIIKEDQSLDEYLKIINKRKEKLRLRSENKKDKYYITKTYEERCRAWKDNANKGNEIRKQQLRDGGRNKIEVYKGDSFIKEYLIPIDAAEDLNIKVKGIHKILAGDGKSYKGYTFKRVTI